MTDTTNDQVSLFREIVNRAVEVLNRHIVPDGISDNDALIELYGIFDGPEYRAATQHSEQRDTVPAGEVTRFSDLDSLQQQSKAWFAVVEALNELRGDWQEGVGTGIELAVAAIRSLAAPVAATGRIRYQCSDLRR